MSSGNASAPTPLVQSLLTTLEILVVEQFGHAVEMEKLYESKEFKEAPMDVKMNKLVIKALDKEEKICKESEKAIKVSVPRYLASHFVT
jgi:hypothetical protein